MPLSTDQKRKIQNHFNDHLKFGKCPVCTGNQWTIENEIIAFPMFDTQYKMIIEGQIFPMFVFTCNKCHYALNFSAMKIGLI